MVARGHPGGVGDRTEQPNQQVDAMAGHVDEPAAARDRGVGAPRTRPIGNPARDTPHGDVHAAVRRPPNGPRREQFPHAQHVRLKAPVVGHEQLHAGAGARVHHEARLGRVQCHRLLHQYVLAGRRRGAHVLQVGGGRGCHVHHVDVGAAHHCRGVVGPLRCRVPVREVARRRRVTAHHDRHAAALGGRDRRPALVLHHVAAANHAPAKLSHARLSHRSPGPRSTRALRGHVERALGAARVPRAARFPYCPA